MTDNAVQLLKAHFDALSQRIPGENVEFCFARDLMEPLGYSRWENFQTALCHQIAGTHRRPHAPARPARCA